MPETIGLDIGSYFIKLVGLKMTSKGPFLTCVGMKEIPPDSDKEGVNAVSEILRALVKEVGLKTKKLILLFRVRGFTSSESLFPLFPKTN
jgi:Tfp pilus assembly PilM family ATPase